MQAKSDREASYLVPISQDDGNRPKGNVKTCTLCQRRKECGTRKTFTVPLRWKGVPLPIDLQSAQESNSPLAAQMRLTK